MADGYITIETKLSTDKFDKQIVNLEKKIKDEENKSELKLKAKLQAEDELKRHKQAIFEIEKEYEKTSQQVEHLQSIMSKQSQGISLTPQEFTDLQGSKEIIALNEKQGAQLDRMYAKEVKLDNLVERTSLAYKQIQGNVQGYKSKIESIKLQKHQAQVNNIKDGFDKMNKSVGNSIKHIGRLALGIISVASAYRLMSSASSTLGQYDEQYATNLEYIRYLIAQAIAPALKYVVNLASTLLSYLNYIAQAWFGITLFSKNSSKNFMKARESTSKIKKDLQTTPFDEMNVLSDTSSSGTSGAVAPSIDPSMLQGEVPEWLKWLGENGELVKKIILGIVSALLGLKLASIAKELGLIGSKLSFIKGLGIGALIYSIIQLIQLLPDYFSNLDSSLENNGTSWQSFGEIIKYIGVAILGLGAIILSVPTAVTGAIVLIVGIIMKYWEQIKSFLQSAIDWFNDAQKNATIWFTDNLDWIGKKFGLVGQLIVGLVVETFNWVVEIIKSAIDIVINVFEGLFKGIKGIFDGILLIFKGDFKGGLISIGKGVVNALIGILNGAISALNGILYPIRALISAIGNVFGANWSVDIVSIPHIPYLKTGGIVKPIRLASGAILNQPGRGVPIAGGRAIAGEAGAEGVIPLTDSQAMAQLGEAIGKYITINANIPVSMNGRVISRPLQQIRNDREFAFNR